MVLCEDMNTETLLTALRTEHVVVYPTDTVYGIGCDATNERAVERVYAIKGRGAKPVSVIVPSLAWIRAHCIIPAYAEEWLAKLPGPYTLILALKDESCVAAAVLQGRTALGVRIPAHACSEVVAQFGKPVVTTSANPSGEPVVTRVVPKPHWLPEDVVVIDGGELDGMPSTVIDCTGLEPVRVR